MKNLFFKYSHASGIIGAVLIFLFICTKLNAQGSASCGNMGVESGWSSWKASTGVYQNGTITFDVPQGIAPAAPRFNITTGGGIDACTPGGAPGAPALPVVAPGFGNSSIQLGQRVTNGTDGRCGTGAGCAERLTYSFTVTAADTNFLYAYAIILENPVETPPSHDQNKVPYAEIYILDQAGNIIPCSHNKYAGSTTGSNVILPGFYLAGCAGPSDPGQPPNGMDVVYKPWTTVGVNLTKYLTQTITVVITNADCGRGGHFCHSYWDFACPPVTGNDPPFCLGNQVTLVAPPSDPSNPYSYTWYVNGVPYTGLPNNTSISIIPIPKIGDIFAVRVHQSSGCDFWVPYLPKPLAITADFTLSNSCGTVKVTDTSPPPNPGSITNWDWSFPGGNPATSTSPTQVVTYTTAGTHTITLDIKSSLGCVATKTLTVTTGNPTAVFSTGPVCLGVTTTFSDGSVAFSGDPIKSWDWSFGDGSILSQQNPSHSYTASGTYSVTLSITTQGGCTTTITHTVTVNPIPVPLFVSKNVCFNNKTIFTDQSSGATQYAWDFGDGSSSTQQNPTHTYGTTGTFSVTLSVANAFGCKAMLPLITVVNPLPVAGFSTLPVCIGNPTCFKDGSTVTPGTVIGWSWNFDDPGSGAANTSSLQNPCHTYKGTGPFTVILTATSDSGCQNTITLPASTNPPPIASIIPRNVCFNSSTTFTDASTSPAGPANAINAWDWNFGDGTANSSQQNPSHLYSAAGTYTITLIVTTVNGCKDTTHNKVVIYHPPVPSFGQPTTGCSPVYANYTDLSASADGTVNKWQWSFPGGSPLTSTVQNPSKILYANPGSYSVSLIVTTTNGCTDSIKLPMVEVYGWPTADFCVAPSIAPSTEPVFTFCDMWSKDVSRWTWDFGDNSAIDTINTTPVHSYSATANNNDFYKYNICIRVETKHGCWATACHSVELIPEFTFYIPNTFTPNGDGTNEMFYGKCRGVKEYNIWVFDRWGNQVWDCHHDDKNTNWDSGLTTPQQEGLASYCQWDGKVVNGGMDMSGNSGQLAQQDVYVWKVSLLDIFNKRHMYIGHVNIVR